MSEKDDMVERVARAIWPDEWRRQDDLAETEPFRWGNRPEAERRDLMLTQARTAISAMREPTEKMVEASNREWDGRMSHRSTGAWQAMIDAALQEPQI